MKESVFKGVPCQALLGAVSLACLKADIDRLEAKRVLVLSTPSHGARVMRTGIHARRIWRNVQKYATFYSVCLKGLAPIQLAHQRRPAFRGNLINPKEIP
jgi:hypothetical protein